MEVLFILMIGILIGFKCFPQKWKKWNGRIQVGSTAVLIFIMGVSLGSRPDFFKELTTLGWDSMILAIIPIAFSIVLVYILTKRFMNK